MYIYGDGLVAKLCPILVTPWTVARQAPLSMGFSQQEYSTGLPFPTPGDLPNPGIKSGSPALQADSLPTEAPGKPVYTSAHVYTHPFVYLIIDVYFILWAMASAGRFFTMEEAGFPPGKPDPTLLYALSCPVHCFLGHRARVG